MTDFDTKETRSERFKRLAKARTNKVLLSLDVLGNCANRTNYQYDEEDVSKMFEAIEKRVQDVKRRYKQQKRGEDFTF